MPASNDDILAELREIRKLLTPAPAAPPPKGMLNEFKTFLDQYKVLGLAVAFILGVYLGTLVKALVGDLVLPIIGLVNPSSNLATYAATFRGQSFMFGDFLENLITFLIVVVVIFLIVKVTAKMGMK